MKSGRKKPSQPTPEERIAGLLRSDDPKVVTLVQVCGNWFGVRRDGAGVKVMRLGAR